MQNGDKDPKKIANVNEFKHENKVDCRNCGDKLFARDCKNSAKKDGENKENLMLHLAMTMRVME